jgi:hypothetical protein
MRREAILLPLHKKKVAELKEKYKKDIACLPSYI